MINKVRLFKPCLSYVAVIASVAMMSASTASLAAASFDGKWSVQVTAEGGECAAGYTVPIRVSNGQVSYSGPFDAQAKGKVNPNGALRVSFAHRKDVVDVRGSLNDRIGHGSWSSPTKNCEGTWIARKA